MAPDASAAAAGRKLGKPGPWKSLGTSERAIWGECQGSAVYQTQVSTLDLASKCSCPSRKFPCKHALGLLFLLADSPQGFTAQAEPEWVTSWLTKRDAAQQKKQARAEQAESKPIDEQARAKRASKRNQNVLAGVEQLEVWLSDIVRRGLGRLTSEGPAFWDAQARRLVDAQAPGLAGRVRAIGGRVGAREDWTARVLFDLGLLAMLTHAYRRIEELPPELAHDVRRLMGFTLDQSEVLAHGDIVEDEWVVAISQVEDEDRLRVQRSWLVGTGSLRRALVVQFAAGSSQFGEVLISGSSFRAKLAFWPGSQPERAFVVERMSAPAMGAMPTRGRSISQALDEYASALAKNPWAERTLFLLNGVRVAPGQTFHLVDAEVQALPLTNGSHDVLWAVSGGHPLLVAAEWDGFELEPLMAFSDGRGVPLVKGAVA